MDGRELKIQLAISELPDIEPARTAGFRRSSSPPASNMRGIKRKRSTNSIDRGSADERSTGTGQTSSDGKAAGGKAAEGIKVENDDLLAELDEYFKTIVLIEFCE